MLDNLGNRLAGLSLDASELELRCATLRDAARRRATLHEVNLCQIVPGFIFPAPQPSYGAQSYKRTLGCVLSCS